MFFDALRTPPFPPEPRHRFLRPARATLLAGMMALSLQAQGAPRSLPPESAPSLAFGDFFEAHASELKASPKLLALAGRRVRLVGFMAKMELPPKGGFYLTPHPVSCDEAGGGTADLPPQAVLVVVRSQAGQEIPYAPQALEVTGRLEVGPRTEADGRTSHLRLILDQPQDLSVSIR